MRWPMCLSECVFLTAHLLSCNVIFVDVDEPWPLEIYDRQGNAVNVTMEPGDMVLYGKFFGDKVLIVMISNMV